MGQEGVPQPLARMGTLHQACNVHHIKESWDFAANQKEKNPKIFETQEVFRDIYNMICLYGYEDNSPKTFSLFVSFF